MLQCFSFCCPKLWSVGHNNVLNRTDFQRRKQVIRIHMRKFIFEIVHSHKTGFTDHIANQLIMNMSRFASITINECGSEYMFVCVSVQKCVCVCASEKTCGRCALMAVPNPLRQTVRPATMQIPVISLVPLISPKTTINYSEMLVRTPSVQHSVL